MSYRKSSFIKKAVKVVSEYYDVDSKLIFSKNRRKEVVKARHILFSIFYSGKFIDLTLYNIRDIFCYKDHSGILHGVNKINAEVEIYPDLKSEYKEIFNILKSKTDFLDDKEIYRHLSFNLFMNHPETLIESGISKNDIEVLSEDFKVTEEYKQKLLDMYDSSKKPDKNKIDKVIKKDIGLKKNKNRIKNHTNGEENDKIRK